MPLDVTKVENVAARAAKALDEQNRCHLCLRFGATVHPHFAKPSCLSNGRRWSVALQDFIGYPHCACKVCF